MPEKIALSTLGKLIFLILIAELVTHLIPYLGSFSFPDILGKYGLPAIITSFANFDGIHYIKIVREGYYAGGYAFFPLYPILIKLLAPLFLDNHILTALFISNCSFVIGSIYLYKLLKQVKVSTVWFFIFLFTFPTSFFFHVAYSESLFFMLTVLCLYFLKNNRPGVASIMAGLISGTRIIGFLLIIPLVIQWWQKSKKRSVISFIVASVIPLVGIGLYMLYQWRAAGDPFAFVHAQEVFGAGRSLSIILLPQVYFRYLKILITTPMNFNYFVALLEVTIFTFAITTSLLDTINRYKSKNSFLFSIGFFSLASMLLPTLTGTFLSTPRFALLSFSSFFYLAELKNKPFKIILALIFSLLQVVLFAFFSRGYFVA